MNISDIKEGDELQVIGNCVIYDEKSIRHNFEIGATVIVMEPTKRYNDGRTGVYCRRKESNLCQTISPHHLSPQTQPFSIKELMSDATQQS